MEESDDLLARVLEQDLPNSVFHRVIGLKNLQLLRGAASMYARLMATYVSSACAMWVAGQLSNFEYLMHVNAAAGRSFQDITQYPIFPWVLADYKSPRLDLQDPAAYRDLRKPMGAQGAKRAAQFRERYATMDEFRREGVEGSPPPFFYGTHYSCAGYVLHYLLRLQPYANMAVSLQGGSFDKPDRLFTSVEHSWRSASQENLQDVRELIPEFFFLPEFLQNANRFDLGVTQRGEVVNDVQLPPWAQGDPIEFVRLHREALESKYVSENLHHWIDLVFGYKQRGAAAEEAMNVFIHLTYDGEVDVDAILDPVLRNATISQINNFGITPVRLFSKPHKSKTVPDIHKIVSDGGLGRVVVDAHTLQWHQYFTPPLCLVGAPHLVRLNRLSFGQVASPSALRGCSVGDAQLLSRDRILSVPAGCLLLPPAYKNVVRIAGPIRGLVVFVGASGPTRLAAEGENEVFSVHEGLHGSRLTCVCTGRSGDRLATGSTDGSIALWSTQSLASQRRLERVCALTGHTAAVLCLDMCPEFNLLVSGSLDLTAAVWDTRAGRLLRVLTGYDEPVVSASVNPLSGQICTLTPSHLYVHTINGSLVACEHLLAASAPQMCARARCVLAPPCAEWQDGVVAVTGHEGGQVCLWRMRKTYSAATGSGARASLYMSYALPRTHAKHITFLRLCSTAPAGSRRDMISRSYEDASLLELLVGDYDGHVSRWSTTRLDALPADELHVVMAEQAAHVLAQKEVNV